MPFLVEVCHSVDLRFEELLNQQEKNFPKRLVDATRYLILGRGKRLRPALLFAGIELGGMPIDRGIDAACAIEMIHTASLMHDDLPPMDNSPTRRGKPSTHSRFDEATAILTGDLLLIWAYQLLGQLKGVRAEEQLSLMQTLSEATALLVAGQAMDLALTKGDPISAEGMEQAFAYKTGSLFQASLKMGAILGAIPKQCALLERIGALLGIAYQLVDDLRDQKEKEPSSYVAHFGEKRTQERLEELHTTLCKELHTLPTKGALLRQLIDDMLAL